MIRTAVLVSLMATSVYAQEQMTYRAALETVVENGADKMAAFRQQIPQGTMDTGMMATQGKLVHLAPDQTLTVLEPELVGQFDRTNGTCIWGTETGIYPLAPRTAAQAVLTYGAANNWPIEAVTSAEMSETFCVARSLIAAELTDLIVVMPLRTDTDVLLVGLKDYGRAPTEDDQ